MIAKIQNSGVTSKWKIGQCRRRCGMSLWISQHQRERERERERIFLNFIKNFLLGKQHCKQCFTHYSKGNKTSKTKSSSSSTEHTAFSTAPLCNKSIQVIHCFVETKIE